MNTKTVIILVVVAAVIGAIIYVSQKSNAPTITQNQSQTTGLTSILNTSGIGSVLAAFTGTGGLLAGLSKPNANTN